MSNPEKPYLYLHGRPVTRDEVARWISEDALRELTGTYLPPLSELEQARAEIARLNRTIIDLRATNKVLHDAWLDQEMAMNRALKRVEAEGLDRERRRARWAMSGDE